MMETQLEDYECCPKCGHIGLLHGRAKGCNAVKALLGPGALRCGCKIKRNLSIRNRD